MNSRERILNAVSFREVDRTAADLGGTRATGISAFAYPRLVDALGLPPRRPRVYDTVQMLALPDTDVLDALGADCVAVEDEITNAFPQPELWREYDFNGRLPALVRRPADFTGTPDGAVLQSGGLRMAAGSAFFDEEPGIRSAGLAGDGPKPDMETVRRACRAKSDYLECARDSITGICRRAREEAPDRAVFADLSPLRAGIGIGSWGGIGVWPMLCMMEPEFAEQVHRMMTDTALENMEALLPGIADSIDVLMLSADDWGTQESLIASPSVFRELFVPFYRELNDCAHSAAPGVKTFFHCCGAVQPLIPDIISAGFDILNPVQWSAGGKTPEEWKKAAGSGIALWGGGIGPSAAIPGRSADESAAESRSASMALSDGGGYVFCGMHNILAETDQTLTAALYAGALKRRGQNR